MYFFIPLCQFRYIHILCETDPSNGLSRGMLLLLVALLHKLDKPAFNLRHVVLQLINQRVMVDSLVDVARLLHKAPSGQAPVGNRRAPHVGARHRLQKAQLRQPVDRIDLPPQALVYFGSLAERVAVDNLGKPWPDPAR